MYSVIHKKRLSTVNVYCVVCTCMFLGVYVVVLTLNEQLFQLAQLTHPLMLVH